MRRAALLALLALGLLACAQLAASLPSQSAVLKRKRGKKKAGAEQRQLAERDWVTASLQRYLSNQELGEWLAGYEKRCKAIAKLSTIGSSGEGRCGCPPARRFPLPPAALAAPSTTCPALHATVVHLRWEEEGQCSAGHAPAAPPLAPGRCTPGRAGRQFPVAACVPGCGLLPSFFGDHSNPRPCMSKPVCRVFNHSSPFACMQADLGARNQRPAGAGGGGAGGQVRGNSVGGLLLLPCCCYVAALRCCCFEAAAAAAVAAALLLLVAFEAGAHFRCSRRASGGSWLHPLLPSPRHPLCIQFALLQVCGQRAWRRAHWARPHAGPGRVAVRQPQVRLGRRHQGRVIMLPPLSLLLLLLLLLVLLLPCRCSCCSYCQQECAPTLMRPVCAAAAAPARPPRRTDPRAKRIVQSMHLWLVPAMNPDGFERKSRGNGCGQGLGWAGSCALPAPAVAGPAVAPFCFTCRCPRACHREPAACNPAANGPHHAPRCCTLTLSCSPSLTVHPTRFTSPLQRWQGLEPRLPGPLLLANHAAQRQRAAGNGGHDGVEPVCGVCGLGQHARGTCCAAPCCAMPPCLALCMPP